jgi:phosphatidyl-myo-inositol dimannoside synthase
VASPDPNPLRIAFLNSWKASSHEGTGTAVGISGLATGLQRLGHSVETVMPRPASGPLLPRRIHFNVGLEERLRALGPFDLVVGFDLDGFLLPRSADLPFVLCLKGVAADEARFESGSQRKELEIIARLEARNARRSGRIVVPSRYSAETAARLYGLALDSLRIVPEPLDPDPWRRLALDSPPRPSVPTLLNVAHQYPRKDTATLVAALPLIRRQVPEARLRVIGGGPELEALRDQARRLGLADHIRFAGSVPGDEALRRAYFQAHVFCLPSRQEGFGIVFLEAMAAGLPIVAARAGAAPEVVEDGRTGLLVPPGNPEALAAAVVRLLQTPDLARTLGEQGRRRIHRYHPTTVAHRFLEAAGRETGRADPAPVRDR